MLEKLIQDDIAAAKTPVLLLAFAGTNSSIARHLFCHMCSLTRCLQQYSVFFSHSFCSSCRLQQYTASFQSHVLFIGILTPIVHSVFSVTHFVHWHLHTNSTQCLFQSHILFIGILTPVIHSVFSVAHFVHWHFDTSNTHHLFSHTFCSMAC